MPLSKLCGEDAQAALRGCGGGARRRHGDEFSNVSGNRAQDLMELNKADFVSRYARTIKAAGLMCYLLESEYDERNDVANKPGVLLKRHGLPWPTKSDSCVLCSLCPGRLTHCLL